MKTVRPTIIRLLSSMASAREIQLYLKRFSQLDADRFAVVKVGGSVLRDELDPLVSSLAFLQQVGLTPIVVHEAGPELDAAMEAAGVERKIVEGLRWTPPEGLAVLRRVAQRQNLRLVEALLAVDVRATSIVSGVFEAALLDREKYGLVGKVTGVDASSIEAAISSDSIPVIASVGETPDGQILHVNPDGAADQLVKRMRPYKIIFLNGPGGILDGTGKLIESISLRTQYEGLLRQPWLDTDTRADLERIHDLLMDLPPSSSLSITKPDEMAKELFTHRGSGTLVRRGEEVLSFDSWEGVDTARLRRIVESSFGRRLVPDYFERTRPYRVYVSEHYRAAIVLTKEGEVPYMDKFAVGEEAQGDGLGRAMWEVVRARNPRLFWRSRRGNGVNGFYFANADGARKEGDWTVFWYGIQDWETIRFAVEHAVSRPTTLLD